MIESVNETGVHDGINVVAITENTDQYYIIKCDYNFNEQWEKTFLTSEFEFSYYYISKNEKGKYDGYISLVYSNEKRCFIIKKYALNNHIVTIKELESSGFKPLKESKNLVTK